MSEKLGRSLKGWRFWGLALILAVIHFVIATGCGLWGFSVGTLNMTGVVLVTISELLFCPLYNLMAYEGFRGFVATYLPGPWGHLIAFALSLCWGIVLAFLIRYVLQRRAAKTEMAPPV